MRFDFAVPQTMRALTYVGPMGGRFADGPQGRIEASDDGASWTAIRTLVGQAHNAAPERTFAFPATTSRHFRVIFERGKVSRQPFPRPPGLSIAELALVPGARADLFEDRAGFGVLADADAVATPAVDAAAAVRSADVLDLTDRLRADGTLDWTAPKGDWIVLRAGRSLTGEVNHPATPEGTGLEVDKLNADHVRAHLDAYMTPVIRDLGPLVGRRGLRYLLTDSWKAGQENWTEPMPAEFRRRRGYDLTHAAGARRPRRRLRRGVRRVPVGFPPHARRSRRRESLRHHHPLRQGPWPRLLRRGDRRRLADRRGRDARQELHRHPDRRVAGDAVRRAAGRVPGRPVGRVPGRHHGDAIHRARVRQAAGGGGIADVVAAAMDLDALDPEVGRRQVYGDGRQPPHHPHLAPSAQRHAHAGSDARPVRTGLHPSRDVGRWPGHGSTISRAVRSCSSRGRRWRTCSNSTERGHRRAFRTAMRAIPPI